MMETTDIQARLVQFGKHVDDERAVRAGGVLNREREAPQAIHRQNVTARKPRTLRRGAFVARAAAVIVLAGAAVGLWSMVNRSDRDGISVSAASGEAGEGAGLFPAGDVAAVVEAGFDDPVSVTNRYLKDRVRHLPDRVDLVPTVGLTKTIDDDLVVVGFSLQGTDDSGDGYALVERVGPEPGAWVVVSSSIIGFDVPTISYRDGSIDGTLSTSSGGATLVEIYDANTNALITTSELSQPAVDEGTAEVSFSIEGIDAPSVGVRFWNIGDLEHQGGPRANFAEVRLYDGDRDVNAGWGPLAAAANAS
jgi:hypothetical protein